MNWIGQPFDFLLLDEPFNHLDQSNTRIATELIKNECKTQHAGIILASLGQKFNFDYKEELML